MYSSIEFIGVKNNQPITKDAYPEFYFEFQRAVLLSLRDAGKITQTQYRAAEEALVNQRNAFIRSTRDSGGNA